MTIVKCRVLCCDYNKDGVCQREEIQTWSYGVFRDDMMVGCHTQFPKRRK